MLIFLQIFQVYLEKNLRMVLLTNKYQYHNLMIENFVDEWVTKKRPDCVLHSNDGHNFKVWNKVYNLISSSSLENILPTSAGFPHLKEILMLRIQSFERTRAPSFQKNQKKSFKPGHF